MRSVVGIGDLSAWRTTIHIEEVTILIVAELLIDQGRESLIGSTEIAATFNQVVVGTVYCTQPERYFRVRQQIAEARPSRMGFGNKNLLKNELKIGFDETGHFLFPRCSLLSAPRAL
ncbi:hypothetical protein D9M68_869580 [compost metagenome]